MTDLLSGIFVRPNVKLVNVTSSKRESRIFMRINPGFSYASCFSEFETPFSHIHISVDQFICKFLLIVGVMSASPLTITIFPLTMQPETSTVISATIWWSTCFSFPVKVLLWVVITFQPRSLIFCQSESLPWGSNLYRVPQATFLLLATTSATFPISKRSLGSALHFKFNFLAASFCASIHILESST